MTVTHNSKEYNIYCTFDSIRGGTNNLDIAYISPPKEHWAYGMGGYITSGRSHKGQTQAVKNAIRNLKRSVSV